MLVIVHFYERKRGEFYSGISEGYIDKSYIIDRYDFLAAYLALKGDPSNARRSGKETLFKEERFKGIMENPNNFKRMFFAYRALTKLEGADAKSKVVFSYGLRYGKMAIIAAIGAMHLDKEITKDNVDGLAVDKIKEVASKWSEFVRVLFAGYYGSGANSLSLRSLSSLRSHNIT